MLKFNKSSGISTEDATKMVLDKVADHHIVTSTTIMKLQHKEYLQNKVLL